jgi:hypothetical protein
LLHPGLNYYKLIYNSLPLSGLIFFTLVKEGWILSADELKIYKIDALVSMGIIYLVLEGVNRVVLMRDVKHCTMLFEAITPVTSHRAV